MKTHVIFGLIVLFIISSSCKKTGRGYIKGKVTEYGTGQPISGAKVNLLKHKDNADEPSSIVLTTTTDSNGDYLFYYTKEKATYYPIETIASDFQNGYSVVNMDENKKTEVNIEMYPFAYIKFRFKKNTTSLNYASVYAHATSYEPLNPGSYNTNSEYYYLYTPYKNYPHIYDTILPTVYSTYGNRNFNMSYTVYTDPVYSESYTTTPIYINKGETLTYLVEFN